MDLSMDYEELDKVPLLDPPPYVADEHPKKSHQTSPVIIRSVPGLSAWQKFWLVFSFLVTLHNLWRFRGFHQTLQMQKERNMEVCAGRGNETFGYRSLGWCVPRPDDHVEGSTRIPVCFIRDHCYEGQCCKRQFSEPCLLLNDGLHYCSEVNELMEAKADILRWATFCVVAVSFLSFGVAYLGPYNVHSAVITVTPDAISYHTMLSSFFRMKPTTIPITSIQTIDYVYHSHFHPRMKGYWIFRITPVCLRGAAGDGFLDGWRYLRRGGEDFLLVERNDGGRLMCFFGDDGLKKAVLQAVKDAMVLRQNP